MSAFVETEHPRAADGTFAEKVRSAAEVTLPATDVDAARRELDAVYAAVRARNRAQDAGAPQQEQAAAQQALDAALANRARGELRRLSPEAAVAVFHRDEKLGTTSFFGVYDADQEWIELSPEERAVPSGAAYLVHQILSGPNHRQYLTPVIKSSPILAMNLTGDAPLSS